MALQMTIPYDKFKARNKQETTTKQLLEDTFNQVKDWMDKVWLKLN